MKLYVAPGIKQTSIASVREVFETHLNEAMIITIWMQQLKPSHTPTALVRKRKFEPNKNHETQNKHFSSEKKRTRQSLPLSKPTIQELQYSVLKLQKRVHLSVACVGRRRTVLILFLWIIYIILNLDSRIMFSTN